MEPTDYRAGKGCRDNVIQPPHCADKESELQGGKGLAQGHTAGSDLVCSKS